MASITGDGIIIEGKHYNAVIFKNRRCNEDCHLFDRCTKKRKGKNKQPYCAGFHEATVFKRSRLTTVIYAGINNGIQTIVTAGGKIYQRNVDGHIGEWKLISDLNKFNQEKEK